jgi:hypothetical protein
MLPLGLVAVGFVLVGVAVATEDEINCELVPRKAATDPEFYRQLIERADSDQLEPRIKACVGLARRFGLLSRGVPFKPSSKHSKPVGTGCGRCRTWEGEAGPSPLGLASHRRQYARIVGEAWAPSV